MFHALIMEFVPTQLVNVNVMVDGKDNNVMYLYAQEIVIGMEQLANVYKDGLDLDAMKKLINVKTLPVLDTGNVIKLMENAFVLLVGMAIYVKHLFVEETVNGMEFNVFAKKDGLELIAMKNYV